MKRYLSIFLCVAMLLFSAACTNPAQNIEKPVTFYYPRALISYDSSQSMIGSEVRETVQLPQELTAILQYYLEGPQDTLLYSPFPQKCRILELSEKDYMVQIVMESVFSELSGISATVACSCLAMTVMELTSCETVQISAKDSFINNLPSITITRSELAFTDPALPAK